MRPCSILRCRLRTVYGSIPHGPACAFPALERFNLVLDEGLELRGARPLSFAAPGLETVHISCVGHCTIFDSDILRLFSDHLFPKLRALHIHGLRVLETSDTLYDISETVQEVVVDCTCRESPHWDYPTL